jgi:isochorismate pyruvate lyase
MKLPSHCKSIEEVRKAIDTIDENIISLLGKRYEYVKEIIRFKEPTEESILAKDRFDAVIETRREFALKEGLDPDLIERIYRELMNHFISEERKLIQKRM